MLFALIPASNAARYRLGDVNGDGKITAKDVLLLRKYLAGITVEISTAASDVNGDGNVSMADILLIRQHIARIITINNYPICDSYIENLKISGIDIANYSIVIPEDHDVFTQYAAELLQDYIKDKSDITLAIVTDDTTETAYEFLLGETNRVQSQNAANAVTLADNEYLLKEDGPKVVMQGESYMIGAGVGKFTYDYITYDPQLTSQTCDITDLPTENEPEAYVPRSANNVIFMIGDGMGQNHITSPLAYNLRDNVEPDYTEFSATRLPHHGLVTTNSVTTNQSGGTTPTDSAAAGTALACGYKTINHYVGLGPVKNRIQDIREVAVNLGKRNAIMSTELQAGATPACFLVHYIEREHLDTIRELEDAVTNCDYIKGDIEEDLLPETKYALDLLSTNNDAGFFAMIEEARIDTYSHNNDRNNVLHAMSRFNKAIQYAMVFAVSHPDTLLIVTADHETGGLTDRTGCIFTTKSHTTANVPIYSIGAWSEHFTGTIDNIKIPKIIAAGWGINNFGA